MQTSASGTRRSGPVDFAGLYLPQVARPDIVYPGRRGMLWQELQVTVEMGLAFGVISDTVAVALQPHSARIHGRQGLPRGLGAPCCPMGFR